VMIRPAWDNTLSSGETTVFTVTVTNPDIAPYEDEPLTVQTDPLMVLTGVDGAPCISCPADGNQWTLATNVEAGATQTITLESRALGSGLSGVYPISITAHMDNSGLPADPQAPASVQYSLDRGLGAVRFLKPGQSLYVKPGQVDLSILTALDRSTLRRCLNQVEANVDGSWAAVCPLGDCSKISGSIGAAATQVWQVRVAGDNGRVSEPISKTLIADSVPPSAQISPTVVLSGNLPILRGMTWDTFPTTRAPGRVEISINGGRFRRAFVSVPRNQTLSGTDLDTAAKASSAEWLFPLPLSGADGETVQVAARAVDEAGNVGASTDPVTFVVDSSGPVISGTLTDNRLEGTVSDGSGVALVDVSLDGGAHYQPATLTSGGWSFQMIDWSGGSRQPFAILRARDVWGNMNHEVVVVDTSRFSKLYMPVVVRGWGTAVANDPNGDYAFRHTPAPTAVFWWVPDRHHGRSTTTNTGSLPLNGPADAFLL
jgi:hypothetical protein